MPDTLYGRNAVREALRAGRRSFERLTVSAGAQEAGTLGEVVRQPHRAPELQQRPGMLVEHAGPTLAPRRLI